MNRFLWQQVGVTYKWLRRSFISIVIVTLILRIQNAARSQAQIRKTQDKMSQKLANKNMFSVEGADLIVRGILFHSSAACTAATPRSPLCLNLGCRSADVTKSRLGECIIKIYFSRYYLAPHIQDNTHEQSACNLTKFIQECWKYISFNPWSFLFAMVATLPRDKSYQQFGE